MTHQPDPNLDDDNLIQAMAENEVAMKHGDPCAMCGAEWTHHYMVHPPDCLYEIVNNMLEARSLLEDMYGAGAA